MSPLPAEPRPTAAAVLAQRLRDGILTGDPPAGTPLREEQLARSHGVSRHTVRAALATLGAERLVEVVPFRGARVAGLDDAALDALQELRGALEQEAVRLLRERNGDRWPPSVVRPVQEAVERLAAAEAAGDWAAVISAHAACHRALVDAAGSPRIAEAYRALDAELLLLLTRARPHCPPGSLAASHAAYLEEVQRSGGAVVRAHLAESTAAIRAARPGA